MRAQRLRRYAAALGIAAALLAGCGGSQPPIRAPVAITQSVTTQARAHRATSGDLLYAAGGDKLKVFTYPQGQSIATLNVNATGLCLDAAGNVWVTTAAEYIYEYAHGGTQPIATLDTGSFQYLTGCAVDRTTGDLAVMANLNQVVVFANASGSGVHIGTPIHSYKCTYDD